MISMIIFDAWEEVVLELVYDSILLVLGHVLKRLYVQDKPSASCP